MSEATAATVQHKHASIHTYLMIAVILAVITALEIGAIYMPLAETAKYVLLIILSIAKFSMVVMFFMHLFYDSRLMTFLFCAGLFMAIMTLLSFRALFHVPSLLPEAPRKAVALAPPSPTRGKEVFATVGCTQCHTVAAVPGANKKIGPDLDGVADRAGSRESGRTAKQYIEESIVSPQAFIVPGYEPPHQQMAELRDRMTDQQFADLVSFLLTLHGSGGK